MELRRPGGLTILTVVLLVLLPALAVLQYRWVGQVSAAEGERMQRSLGTAAVQFREEFDGEIGRAFLSLLAGPETARLGASEFYSDRYDTWLSTASHPRVIKDVFLIDEADLALRLRKWNPASRRFDLTPWVPALEKWRADFQQDLVDFIARRPPDRPFPYRGDESLITALLRSREPAFGFTVLQLDLPYIRSELLPELARLHFGHVEGDAYRVAVVSADDPAHVLFESNPQAPVDVSKADATEPLFGRGFSSRGRGRGESRASDSSTESGGLRRDDGARWRLFVQHQQGSLEAAVTIARRRNLAVGFGILLLLTISVGLLAASSRRAQRLMRQQMEFVAGVSHELRTPVAVIKSAAENLSHGVVGSPDRVKRYGAMIEDESRRLGEMIERVLQFAGIESGRLVAASVPLAPGALVEAAVAGSRPLLGDAPVNVHCDIDPDLPTVAGDESALRSAVENLIINAAKYGGTDRWIGVRVQRVRHRRRIDVRIAVSDHGAGIPGPELAHIFEPFYRGADAVARQIHGNGLGLSLVRRIVEAHGGDVIVTSRPGAGTTFTITLPALDATVGADAAPGAAPAVQA